MECKHHLCHQNICCGVFPAHPGTRNIWIMWENWFSQNLQAKFADKHNSGSDKRARSSAASPGISPLKLMEFCCWLCVRGGLPTAELMWNIIVRKDGEKILLDCINNCGVGLSQPCAIHGVNQRESLPMFLWHREVKWPPMSPPGHWKNTQ